MEKQGAMMRLRAPIFSLICLLLLVLADSASSRREEGYVVEGRVKVEALNSGSGVGEIKVILNGGRKVAFVQPNGHFTLLGVAPGTHLLEVAALGYHFAPIRLDVSERLHGQVHAVYTETRRSLAEPLLLEPLRADSYYEKREPFSLSALLKKPMVLMAGVMIVAVFGLPKLVDSMDPEDREKMQNQPVPSFANLLQGRTS